MLVIVHILRGSEQILMFLNVVNLMKGMHTFTFSTDMLLHSGMCAKKRGGGYTRRIQREALTPQRVVGRQVGAVRSNSSKNLGGLEFLKVVCNNCLSLLEWGRGIGGDTQESCFNNTFSTTKKMTERNVASATK